MGYVDRPSAEPGSSLALHVRADGERWTARAVRLLALEVPTAGVNRIPVKLFVKRSHIGSGRHQQSQCD